MMYATSCRYPAPGLIVATPPRRASSPLLYDTEYLPTEAVRFFTGTWAFQHCGSNGNNGKQTGVHTNVFGFGAVAKDETFHLHGVRIWSDDESVRRALATHYAIHVGNGQHRFATTHAGAALFAPNSGTFFPITAEMARDALHGGEGDGPAIVTGGRDEITVELVGDGQSHAEGLVRVELVGTPMRARADGGADADDLDAVARANDAILKVVKDLVDWREAVVQPNILGLGDLVPHLEKRLSALEAQVQREANIARDESALLREIERRLDAIAPKKPAEPAFPCRYCGAPGELRVRSTGSEVICAACLRQRVLRGAASLVRAEDPDLTLEDDAPAPGRIARARAWINGPGAFPSLVACVAAQVATAVYYGVGQTYGLGLLPDLLAALR